MSTHDISATVRIVVYKSTFIPASQRPDGTWRRARRVKDGYVPQEEVPLYESKGRQFAQRKANTLPPGLCPEVVEAARREREKKEKAKAKKEAAAAAATKKQPIPGVLKLPANTITETKKPIANGQKAKTPAATGAAPSKSNDLKAVENLSENLANNLKVEDEAQDLQKKCKKLQKKLREIDEIEKKLKSGALKKPEKDQLDKVARKGAIEKELQQVLAQMNSES
ncbi:partner of Y14 and mago-like [Musca vetustissima]|uniref:partner of Y14 and mago-like n=1 Tax=Musca vetustissima TaxID=27455 RepID=UPI002AB7D0CF|nr:partner of Y14 and mago-like [Musca vetustissima]XP_061401645.1 partner of Y14 and mago-like [Musca vetustissima]